MSDDDDEANEQTKEVYAFFGLAMFSAQVLEHGIVNAMVVGRTDERHRITRADIDAFMATQFARTLGQMLRELRRHLEVPAELEPLLTAALKRRNWLAHAYFRERAEEFVQRRGRAAMITELQEAVDLFQRADKALSDLTLKVREQLGIDDDAIERMVEESLRDIDARGDSPDA